MLYTKNQTVLDILSCLVCIFSNDMLSTGRLGELFNTECRYYFVLLLGVMHMVKIISLNVISHECDGNFQMDD